MNNYNIGILVYNLRQRLTMLEVREPGVGTGLGRVLLDTIHVHKEQGTVPTTGTMRYGEYRAFVIERRFLLFLMPKPILRASTQINEEQRSI